MSIRSLKRALVAVGFGAFSTMASAAILVDTIDGNDCAGVFGANFNECRVLPQYDINETPIIIKFDFNDAGVITDVEINSALFPSIDGDEFSFDFGDNGTGDGIWTYNPDPDDPLINFFVAAAGSNFNLFRNDGDPNSDSWFTPTNPGGQAPNLSHLSFYDTDRGGGQVPEPMPLALLGAGLLGLVLLRRRSAR